MREAVSEMSRGQEPSPGPPRPADGTRSAGLAFRPDVQGLRAVAVLLVVCAHVVGWPDGGFIGVDVFFVISGFLITGSLLQSGGGGLWSGTVKPFYARRVRRIVPAALVTLAATTVVSRIVFSDARADAVATDAVWSAAFAANWHFADVGTDYFGSSVPASPLQHYWSLAVEEQFYLIWPLALGLVLLALRGRRPGAVRWTALGLAVVVVTASFGWACAQTSAAPLAAYFSTASRGWEIGVGAALACMASSCARIPPRLREPLALAGVTGILVAAVLVNGDTPLPGPGAALPVIATACFLAAGTGAVTPVRTHRFLTSVPALHLGALSFSAYLWHWPVMVLVGAMISPDGWPTVVIVLAATLALSEASYRFVERPFLRPESRHPMRDRWRWAAVAGAATVVVLAPIPGPRAVQAPLPDEAVSLPMPQATHAPADSDPQASAVHDQIVAALDAEGFPALVPPIDDPDQGVAPEMELAAKCLNPPDPSDTRACTARSERSNGGLVVVLGDSVALSWLPGIRAALVPQGYAVHAVTFSNCPPALVDVELDSESWTRACASGLADALDQVDRLRPDLVIGSSFQNALDLVVARSSNLDARASYIQGLVDVSERVGAAGARFVLLGPPPAGPSPLDCGGRFQHPSDCVTSPRGNFEATLSAFASAAAQGQFGFIDTAPWFCDGSACPGFAGGRLIRWDNAHLTEQFAQYLAPILRSALLREIDAGSMTPTP